jgi:UDP-N-acetylglucosamine 1-carboxyvinyltransferase
LTLIQITGGRPLEGVIKLSGSKNSALPILAASLLSEGPVNLKNVPKVRDISIQLNSLKELGIEICYVKDNVILNPKFLNKDVLDEKARSIRGSILFLGPLLARRGRVTLPFPGGCNIGTRNIDILLGGLKKLGAKIYIKENHIYLESKKLSGADINLPFPSVGATENILMASTMAEGETNICNAAIEPEVIDLEIFLSKMGACINGIGSRNLKIVGRNYLKNIDYSIMPDRIELGTYIIACAISGGNLIIKNRSMDQGLFLNKIKEMGVIIKERNNAMQVIAKDRPVPTEIITAPFPGFATDLQPLIVPLMAIADGTSSVTETIYDNRLSYSRELRKMGANIEIVNNKLIIDGVKTLKGAYVRSTDLRGGASLVLAGLNARGKTSVEDIEYVDRGYENIDLKLRSIGADIYRLISYK